MKMVIYVIIIIVNSLNMLSKMGLFFSTSKLKEICIFSSM